jgi:hypothetical protein
MSAGAEQSYKAAVYLEALEGRVPTGVAYSLTGAKPITVVLGRNGSGKSHLLRAVRDANSDCAIYIPPERGGELTPNIGQDGSAFDSRQRAGMTNNDTEPSYRRYAARGLREYYTSLADVVSRGKAGAVRPQELEALVEPLLPGFTVGIIPAPPHFRLTREGDDRPITDTSPLSSGESEMLTVGLDILAVAANWECGGQERRVLLVDEPDLHIHTDLQARFAAFLVTVARRFRLQLVVSTHNTAMAAAIGQFGGDEVGIAYLRPRPGKSQIHVMAMDAMRRDMTAVLGGHALMGPLFGAPILLVEGDDDYKVWSQVPRHGKVALAVVPGSGESIKKCQRALEAVFSSLMSEERTVGYALLDGDKAPPNPEDSNHPQRFVRFVQLACHECENLYLTDEVLKELGLDWSKACASLAQKADDYGNKAELLRSAAEWDRKAVDIKKVIKEISWILDEKRVDWALRVGQHIGREKPSGQLAEFLGEGLVAALWG